MSGNVFPIPELRQLAVRDLHATALNPRSDPQADLDGLAASLGTPDTPRLIQPPLVETLPEGGYRIIAGERRILAAQQAGWESLPCLVYPPQAPSRTHQMRLLENLHRRDLNPLDEAAALKIAWLLANAAELGCLPKAEMLLAAEHPPTRLLRDLSALLEEHAFTSNHPPVTWDALLSQLGLDINPERRKKLLAVLSVNDEVQEQVRSQGLEITEAALRAIGTLPDEQQQRLVDEIAENPDLARKARRIARVVREGDYSLDEALAEASGQAEQPAEEEAQQPADERITSAVVQLLEAANQVSIGLNGLGQLLNELDLPDLPALPEPWGEYAQEALNLLQQALRDFRG